MVGFFARPAQRTGDFIGTLRGVGGGGLNAHNKKSS